MNARTAALLTAACLLLDSRLSLGEGCSDLLEAEPTVHQSGVDVITVMSCGGSIGQVMAASVDATGRVTFLDVDQAPGEALEASVVPSAFADLVARATEAIKPLLDETDQPNSTTATLGDMLRSLDVGRVKRNCSRATDGIDRDVMFYIDGSTTHLVCVGQRLGDFNRRVAALARAAVGQSP